MSNLNDYSLFCTESCYSAKYSKDFMMECSVEYFEAVIY